MTLVSSKSPYNDHEIVLSHISPSLNLFVLVTNGKMVTKGMIETASLVNIEKYKTTDIKSIWRKPSRFFKSDNSFICTGKKLIRSITGDFITIKEAPLRFQTVSDDQIRKSLPNVLDKIKQFQAAFILDREIGEFDNRMSRTTDGPMSDVCPTPMNLRN